VTSIDNQHPTEPGFALIKAQAADLIEATR
jgi:hypothetical protein